MNEKKNGIEKLNKIGGIVKKGLVVGLPAALVMVVSMLTGCVGGNTDTPTPTPDPGKDPTNTPIVEDNEKDATEQDIESLVEALDGKFGSSFGYTTSDDKFYVYAKKNNIITLHEVSMSDESGLKTNFDIESLIEDIQDSKNTAIASFSNTTNYVEYDGYKYNSEGIKGRNVFGERLGNTASQAVTSFNLDIEGTTAQLDIVTVTASKTIIATVTAEAEEDLTTETALALLLDSNKSEITKQTIQLGHASSSFENAEKPTEIEIGGGDIGGGGTGGDIGGGEDITDPPVVDQAPTETQLAEFRQLLDSKATGNILGYDIKGGKLYTFEETNSALTINYLTLYEGEGIETTSQLEALSEAVDTYGLRNFNTISRENTTVDYNGYTYGFNSVGGGVLGFTADRTSIADFQKIADSNSPTGFSVEVDVMLENQNGVFEYSATAPVDEGADTTAMFDALKGLSADDWTITQVSNTQVLGNSSIVFAEPTQIKTEDGGTTGGGTENPNPDTPGDEVTDTLDFSALETKLEEVINGISAFKVSDAITSLTTDGSNIYVIAEVANSRTGVEKICQYVYSLNETIEQQSQIDNIVSSIASSDLTETTLMQKASSDITVNGTTYSKDGIEGDNAFARQCGIDNAIMTYVSDMGIAGESFNSNFSTGYSSAVSVLTIYINEEGQLNAKKCNFSVESYLGYTDEQMYSNLILEGKNIKENETKFCLGQNLKQEETATALNSSAKYSSVEPIFFFNNKEMIK